MNISLSNFNKPSHKAWRLAGKIAVAAILVYTPIIQSLPISEVTKTWVLATLAFTSATISLISEFTIDPNYVEPTISSTEEPVKQ